MTEIRPEVVAGVLDGNPLAAEYCTWAGQQEALRITALRGIAIRQELLAQLGFKADQLLPAEYVKHVARFLRSSDVADATFTEAVSMWRQSVAYDAAVRLLVSWWPHQAEDKTLGELLQAIPADVAGEVVGRGLILVHLLVDGSDVSNDSPLFESLCGPVAPPTT